MRSCYKVAVTAFVLAAFAAPVAAQGLWIGAGASIPSGDYGDYADTGWIVNLGAGMPVGTSGLGVGVELTYGQNSHSDVDGDSTNPISIMGGLGYNLGGEDSSISPYVFGMLGMMFHKYNSDEFEGSTDSGLGFGGGAGINFPLGGLEGYLEGRYLTASIDESTTAYIGITAGVNIALGGN